LNGANQWRDIAQHLLQSTGVNREVDTALLAWLYGLRLMQRRGRIRPMFLSGRLFYDPAMNAGVLRAFVVRMIAKRALEQYEVEVSESAVRFVAKALSRGSLDGISFEDDAKDTGEVVTGEVAMSALSPIRTPSSA
jgi:hypothetical protein